VVVVAFELKLSGHTYLESSRFSHVELGEIWSERERGRESGASCGYRVIRGLRWSGASLNLPKPVLNDDIQFWQF
jgi:hypothetical protein